MFPGQRWLHHQRAGKADHGNYGSWVKVSVAAFLVVVIPLAFAQEKPCCSITGIDTRAGLVSAKVNATGQSFEFKPNTPGLLASMKVGEAIYASFTTRQVSVDGKTPCGSIVNLGPAKGPLTPAAPSKAPNPPPAPQPGISPRAAGGSTPQAGPVASIGGTSAACCGITRIDARTRLAAAKVNSTGQGFEFSLPNSVPIQNLTVGQLVWANFKTRKVSLDGKTPCCNIVTLGAAGGAANTGTLQPTPESVPAGAREKAAVPPSPTSAPVPSSPPIPAPGGRQPPSGSGTSDSTSFVPSPQVGPSITSFTVQPTLIFGRPTGVDVRPPWWCSDIALTLNSPAPENETFSLSTDQPAIATILWWGSAIPFNAGQQTGENWVCAYPVLSPTEVHITAKTQAGPLGADTKTASLTVWPPFLDSFAVGGQPGGATIASTYRIEYVAWLSGGAPPSGFLIEVTSSNPSLIPSHKFVIPQNGYTVQYFDYAPVVTAPAQVTLTAKGYIPQPPKGSRPEPITQVQWVPEIRPPSFPHAGPQAPPFTETVTIVPLNLVLIDAKLAGVVLADGTVADVPDHICPGNTLKGRVVLNHAAGHPGVPVQLQDVNGVIQLPPYATVPENYDTGDFTMQPQPQLHPGDPPESFTVTATYSGTSKNIDFQVYAPCGYCPCN